MSKKNLKFTYCDANGQTKEWEIERWSKDSTYIKGFSAHGHGYRTFRKDRVIAFLMDNAPIIDIPPPPPNVRFRAQHEILFTGFKKAERAELEALAESNNMKVRKTVTDNLHFLVAGETAGPRKLEDVQGKETYILDRYAFKALIDYGVLPN